MVRKKLTGFTGKSNESNKLSQETFDYSFDCREVLKNPENVDGDQIASI